MILVDDWLIAKEMYFYHPTDLNHQLWLLMIR